MIIILTGTPGVGKSTISKILAEKLNAKIIDLKEVAGKHKIILEYDEKTMSMVIDESKISKAIKAEIEKNQDYIIPSHLSHFISPRIVDFCFVLRCDPIVLERRLEKRGYSKQKVAENVMCEFLDACLIESIEMGHKKHLHEIDTSNKKPKEVVDEILDIVSKKKKMSFGEIKWIKDF